MNLLSLKLKTSNLKSLKKYLVILNLILIKFNVNFILLNNNTKKKISVFTVLKSPHVFKSSQDQFGFHIYTNIKQMFIYKYKKLLVIVKNLTLNSFSDISIKIKLILSKKKLTLKKKAGLLVNNTNFLYNLDFLGEIIFKQSLNLV